MVWIFMVTKYMGEANNTQINEHKQSSTGIVIMYWSTSVLIKYVNQWIRQINMFSVADLNTLSNCNEKIHKYLFDLLLSNLEYMKRALLNTVIALFEHQVTLFSGY